MKNKIKVFLIVLNWQRPSETIECLKSISKLKILDFELTVVTVDNASGDDSIEKISNYLHKQNNFKYQLIENKGNLGYAGGMNSGFKYAQKKCADFIVPINNDVRFDSNLIIELLDTAKKNPEAGVLCPKIYFEKGFEYHKDRYKQTDLGNVIWYAGGDIDWNNVYGSNHGVDEIDFGQYNKVQETDFATGNCMFINAKALSLTGGFDERYFMYLEDVDLCMRMKKLGWKIVYSPNAYMWHKVAQSSGIGSDLNEYFITRNRMLFGMKYAGLRAKIALLRESIRFLINGRKWQRIGIKDFYIGNFGKGSWRN